MAKAAQLKMKASEFEQRKQYDRALATYVQAIEVGAQAPDELDIPLYNRVGDLHLRLGDLDQAVAYYETAIDLYAEGGFFNNAIALCNKVLRHAPSRNVVYYKLGKISAKKGFNSDAKQNFLEYADRMQKAGEIDEAFRALIEFADLCPSQDDVRLMLADQLARAGRTDEALEQLYIVYNMMISEDRTTEAAATLERMRALDPAAEPKEGYAQHQEKRDSLVFIDVSDKTPPAGVVSPVVGFEPTALSTDLGKGEQESLAAMPVEAIEERDAPPSLVEESVSHLAVEGGASSSSVDGLVANNHVEETPLAGLESRRNDEQQVLDAPPSEALPEAVTSADGDFVDLQAWLLETEPPKNPRMTAEGEGEEQAPGAVQTDFTRMLETFKRGVAAHVDESDSDSQYDLGVAYMEMGLFVEAVAQFQKAIRGNATPERRLRAYESLGQCFIEQGQYDVAVMSLRGALQEPWSGEDKLVGVLYFLGYASERLGAWGAAAAYYQRVFAIDIHFRDVETRLPQARRAAQSAPAS